MAGRSSKRGRFFEPRRSASKNEPSTRKREKDRRVLHGGKNDIESWYYFAYSSGFGY